jgi:hypothetical protein
MSVDYDEHRAGRSKPTSASAPSSAMPQARGRHLPPPDHAADLSHGRAVSTDNLAKEYFGDQGMLGYVKNVQRQEIRQGIACVKHQNMSGSDIGDDHKEYFAGEAAAQGGRRSSQHDEPVRGLPATPGASVTVRGMTADELPGPQAQSPTGRKRTGSIRPTAEQKAQIKELSRERTGSASAD